MDDGKRIRTLIICLVLIMSGLFMVPAIGADLGARDSARYTDLDPNDNNFAPNITITGSMTPELWNDNADFVLLTVSVSDEDKNSTGGTVNATGGSIASVTADLSSLGGSPTTAMYDDGATGGDVTPGDNIWTYTLTTNQPAGWYMIYFNVTDNGTGTSSGMMWNNTMDLGMDVNLTVKQINRAPVAAPDTVIVKFNEDMYNDTLDLSTIFSDIDGDTITYTMDLMGETNISAVRTGNMVNISAIPNWYGSAGFVITGNDSSIKPPQAFTDDLTVTVMVSSVNDMPMLNGSDEWDVNANVTYVADDKFEGDEDDMWWINVTAWDWDVWNPSPDQDELTFEVENIADLPSIFSIDATTGIFEFTPTNNEVGMHTVNVTVTDTFEIDYRHITFDVGNVNDEPKLTKVWVGTSSVDITNHAAALTGSNAAMEDEMFNFTVEGMDEDVGDTLTFTIESGPTSMTKMMWGNMKSNFSYTPSNADSLAGSIEVNISIRDGGLTMDDYVVITIDVDVANDPPMIVKVAGQTPDTSMLMDMGKIKVGEYDNFTIEASDIDEDVLTVSADDTDADIEAAGGGVWNISYKPSAVGNYTVNITVTDGKETVYYLFKWEVESAQPPPPPNEAPTITITSAADKKVALGKVITIEGTVSDPDGDNVVIKVEILMPDDTAYGLYDDIPGILGYDDITYNADGSWVYTYDTSNHDLGGIIGGITDAFYTGTWEFIFIAEDDHGKESTPVSYKVTVEDKDSDEDDAKGLLALGIMLCLLIILIPVIIIIVIIVLLLKKKKAKAAPPPEMPPPAPPMACTACGAEIPPGAPTCPACGAPAPVPAAPMACTACGAEIPPGAPTCPACGAPAPAEAAPPVETMCECGATIPAGSPTCPACGRPAPAPMPPEGAMPMACTSCGAEVPPGSEICPACGAPAPAPAAPAEGEPAEGEEAPAEEAQMVACPTCGAQIAVGATPCPSCGTALNWG